MCCEGMYLGVVLVTCSFLGGRVFREPTLRGLHVRSHTVLKASSRGRFDPASQVSVSYYVHTVPVTISWFQYLAYCSGASNVRGSTVSVLVREPLRYRKVGVCLASVLNGDDKGDVQVR